MSARGDRPAATASPPPGAVPPERRLVPDGVWFDLLMGFLLVALTVGLAAETPLLSLDIAVRNVSDQHRPPGADLIATIINRLGQGLPLTLLCLALALWHTRRLRTYEPVLAVACAFGLTYVSIGAIKVFTGRGAPHYGSVLLFGESAGRSYPSGHAANVVVWYGVLAMLLAPFVWPWVRRALRYCPVLLVSFTTTYLGYHWVTDTLAGLLVGVMIDRVIRRNPWRRWPWLMTQLDRPARAARARPTR